MNIAGETIERVVVVDDFLDSRDALADALTEVLLEPVDKAGPLPDLTTFIDDTIGIAHGALCDHHLKQGGRYARFDGAEAVKLWYERSFPAILCTSWAEAEVDRLRPLRRYLPVVLSLNDIDPDAIVHGLEACIHEFRGRFRQSRKPVRTLVRVEERDDTYISLIVPAWHPHRVVKYPRAELPRTVADCVDARDRFRASVNLGAEQYGEVFFADWEVP